MGLWVTEDSRKHIGRFRKSGTAGPVCSYLASARRTQDRAGRMAAFEVRALTATTSADPSTRDSGQSGRDVDLGLAESAMLGTRRTLAHKQPPRVEQCADGRARVIHSEPHLKPHTESIKRQRGASVLDHDTYPKPTMAIAVNVGVPAKLPGVVRPPGPVAVRIGGRAHNALLLLLKP